MDPRQCSVTTNSIRPSGCQTEPYGLRLVAQRGHEFMRRRSRRVFTSWASVHSHLPSGVFETMAPGRHRPSAVGLSRSHSRSASPAPSASPCCESENDGGCNNGGRDDAPEVEAVTSRRCRWMLPNRNRCCEYCCRQKRHVDNTLGSRSRRVIPNRRLEDWVDARPLIFGGSPDASRCGFFGGSAGRRGPPTVGHSHRSSAGTTQLPMIRTRELAPASMP